MITVREDPFPSSNGLLGPQEQMVLMTVRRNLINVFRQLSKAQYTSRENPLNILPIRRRVGETEEETAHRSSDAPGLLFYYLFEDWYSAFNLVARREHRYAFELDELVGSLQDLFFIR